MTDLVTHAAWIMVAAFVLSFIYELYRVTIAAGTSDHDSMRAFVRLLVVYVVAALVIAALFTGFSWAAWVGLAFSILMILVSIFYYNPKIMLERQPGVIDWLEDLIYTGLLFVVATLLLYDVMGYALQP